MLKRSSLTAAASGLALCLALAACDNQKADFDKAPSARADAIKPKATGSDTKAAPVDTSSKKLPADHPPVGSNLSNKARVMPPAKGRRAPVSWTAPAGWQQQPPSNSMRLAQFAIPSSKEGVEPALMTVTFLPGTAGGVDANLNRWIGQFKDVKLADTNRSQATVHGLKVHRVDVTGAYGGMGGAYKENQRLLGAIVEAAGGLVFFKLTGPADTVSPQAKAFDDFMASIKPST